MYVLLAPIVGGCSWYFSTTGHLLDIKNISHVHDKHGWWWESCVWVTAAAPPPGPPTPSSWTFLLMLKELRAWSRPITSTHIPAPVQRGREGLMIKTRMKTSRQGLFRGATRTRPSATAQHPSKSSSLKLTLTSIKGNRMTARCLRKPMQVHLPHTAAEWPRVVSPSVRRKMTHGKDLDYDSD